MQQTRRFLMPTVTMLLLFGPAAQGADSPFPGERGKDLDTACRPDIWEKQRIPGPVCEGPALCNGFGDALLPPTASLVTLMRCRGFRR